MIVQRLRTLGDRAGGAAVALALALRTLRHARPATRDVAARLTALPRHLPLDRAVTIHWDAHQIPFIEAATDDDLAVALGAVHAHLRLAQMEMLRRLSQGRIAEVTGPLAVELDRALRLFGFGRAVPAILAGLAPETRRWTEGFLRGVNAVGATAAPPPEFSLLGLSWEPWTLADLFTAARLAGADVNWMVWARLLRTRASLTAEEWRALWPRLLRRTPPTPPVPEDTAEAAVTAFARNGSNAAAVAGWRSGSGAALLAADPHLSVGLPNIWLACAFASPGYQAAGLMPAGFPLVAIGRTPHLAWAGTSLHAASSDLIDARGLTLTERRETIRVRGGRDRTVTLRESPVGPIVSDGMLLRAKTPLALAWVGHRPSDEMGAMLGVLRARDGAGFRAALADFALPGQNMIHAGADGRIGHLLAVRVPRRPRAVPADLIAAPEAVAPEWDRLVGTDDLPHWTEPAAGFVASANDRPAEETPVPVGFFFSPADRVTRLRALLGGTAAVDLAGMAALQQDVTGVGAPMLRDALLDRLGPTEDADAALLRAWRGDYATDSAGALLFEVMLGDLAARLARRGRLRGIDAVWTTRALLAEEIAAMPADVLRPLLAAALRRAGRARRRYGTWGGAHRMRLRHHLGALPLLGARFRYGEWAAPGGNDTLNKTGHAPVRRRHAVSYGASARFLADLAAPDANRVVLLGGQDGWLGSTTFLDQAPLWCAGRYIDLPLRPEAARLWPHRTVLTPG